MTNKKISVSEKTGFSAYKIAGYVLKENGLDKTGERAKLVIEDWIVEKNNNDYRFADKSEIFVPEGKYEIALYLFGHIIACKDGKSKTLCHDGWRLTINGRLVRGKTGWLRDENGLYILQDGRRLDGKHKECTEDLRIGHKDIWIGLKEILGYTSKGPKKKDIYKTTDLFKEYGPYMTELVVYQAFQINICYISGDWNPCTRKQTPSSGTVKPAENCRFKRIGTDETGIPIVVTEIKGHESPIDTKISYDAHSQIRAGVQKKLVIAGPHGNERNARFVVLETQKYFIENGVTTPNLVLYFIPAMSPTMFFADARGLPFVENKDNYVLQEGPFPEDELKKKVEDICKYLTIPKLHDFMATKHNGSLIHDLIQGQTDPVNPKYGIDANRDYHLVLPSSKAFAEFIKPLTGVDVQKKTGTSNNSCTIFMLHGYESIISSSIARRKNEVKQLDHSHGVCYGPYFIGKNSSNVNKRYMNEDIMNYTDLVNLCLFVYRFEKGDLSKAPKPEDNKFKLSENYFYQSVNSADRYRGEWTWHLYGEKGERSVLTFDIELGESYRQGTRGKLGERYTDDMGYHSDIVIKHNEPSIGTLFFQKEQKGCFIKKIGRKIIFIYPDEPNDEENVGISFFAFLSNFYNFIDKVKKSDEIQWKK